MRSRPTLSLAAATLTAAAALLLAPPSGAGTTPAAATYHADPDTPRVRAEAGFGPRQQTSDGVPGTRVPWVPSALLAKDPIITNEYSWIMAPGLTYRQWDQTDARGTIRAYLMTMDLAAPNLKLDYAWSGEVSRTRMLQWMIQNDGAIAGINGDFFDISDTGAPLGVGKSRDGTINGRDTGWNNAFYLTRTGVPMVGSLPMVGRIKEHPEILINNLNSPTVPPGAIGVYNKSWGKTKGYRVTDDIHSAVREVRLKNNRVVWNRTRLTSGTRIKNGYFLIGRGPGADALAKLKVGDKVRVAWRLAGSPLVAITGDRPLLLGGVSQVINDVLMHPRTAVGIDRDTNTLLFLTIDGRQAHSRGYTMVELANLMLSLGAEDALNLDGGGSTTMVGPDAAGVVGVRNSPSDGHQRKVPNGLEILLVP